MNVAFDLPDWEAICSMNAAERSGLVAIGYYSGVVRVISTRNVAYNTTVLQASFGRGPVWAHIDEAEAKLWVAKVTGEVYLIDMHEAGVNGTDFKEVGKHSADIYSACFNVERGYFITADAKGDIAAWNTRTDVAQPRRVFSAPEREKWHVVASSNDHIIAARHNPEVFVFDLAGSAYEVRTLSRSEENTRQVRSLVAAKTFFVAGFSDGAVQRVAFADRSKGNVFCQTSRQDVVRTIVHRAEGKLFPVDSMVLVGDSSTKPVVVSVSGDGVYATDLSNPERPKVTRLLRAPANFVTSSSPHLMLASCGKLALIDERVTLPAPKVLSP